MSIWKHSSDGDHHRATVVLTPRNNKANHGVCATDDAERCKVPHMIIVCDSQ